VHNFIGHIYCKFMKTSLWCHVYTEHSQLVQYFAYSFITCDVLKPLQVTSTRKMNTFSNKNCLKHFISLHRPIIQIYLSAYWHTPVRLYETRLLRSQHQSSKQHIGRAQIHRYCLKIYPKMYHKIILRQKLRCRKIILWHILGSWARLS